MKVTIRVKEAVLLGQARVVRSTGHILMGSLVVPHSGASFLTQADTGLQGHLGKMK